MRNDLKKGEGAESLTFGNAARFWTVMAAFFIVAAVVIVVLKKRADKKNADAEE